VRKSSVVCGNFSWRNKIGNFRCLSLDVDLLWASELTVDESFERGLVSSDASIFDLGPPPF